MNGVISISHSTVSAVSVRGRLTDTDDRYLVPVTAGMLLLRFYSAFSADSERSLLPRHSEWSEAE